MRTNEIAATDKSILLRNAIETEIQRFETARERGTRMTREYAALQAGQVHVPGRTLPLGKQWIGWDIPGRGQAPARRLRQAAKLAAKKEASCTANAQSDVVAPDKSGVDGLAGSTHRTDASRRT